MVKRWSRRYMTMPCHSPSPRTTCSNFVRKLSFVIPRLQTTFRSCKSAFTIAMSQKRTPSLTFAVSVHPILLRFPTQLPPFWYSYFALQKSTPKKRSHLATVRDRFLLRSIEMLINPHIFRLTHGQLLLAFGELIMAHCNPAPNTFPRYRVAMTTMTNCVKIRHVR